MCFSTCYHNSTHQCQSKTLSSPDFESTYTNKASLGFSRCVNSDRSETLIEFSSPSSFSTALVVCYRVGRQCPALSFPASGVFLCSVSPRASESDRLRHMWPAPSYGLRVTENEDLRNSRFRFRLRKRNTGLLRTRSHLAAQPDPRPQRHERTPSFR